MKKAILLSFLITLVQSGFSQINDELNTTKQEFRKNEIGIQPLRTISYNRIIPVKDIVLVGLGINIGSSVAGDINIVNPDLVYKDNVRGKIFVRNLFYSDPLHPLIDYDLGIFYSKWLVYVEYDSYGSFADISISYYRFKVGVELLFFVYKQEHKSFVPMRKAYIAPFILFKF